jgi:DNA polymerase-3 subunit delta
MPKGTTTKTTIVTLSGSNSYMLHRSLEDSTKSFKERFGDLSIEQIDGAESDNRTITDSLLNLPFLSPSKLIILHSPGTNKQFVEQIEMIVENIPSTNEVIIVEPSVDKRSKYYKSLKELTEFKDFDELEASQLAGWVLDRTVEKGGKISKKEASYLIDTVGIDQMRIDNEVSKLINYDPEITQESIDLLVEPIPQTTIFQLLDAAFAGNKKELLRIYEDQRQQKVEPQQIVAMLTWQLNNLALIKAAGNLSPQQISAKTKINPYIISKSMPIVRKFSFDYIKSLIDELLELDIKLKTRSIDSNDAITQFLLSISG